MQYSFSIITSTFNCSTRFSDTALSIRNANSLLMKPIQWIVIDGNSTDDTKSLIQNNIDLISNIIIEPDSGIYDAWNKGLKFIDSNWILFLGAGDLITKEWAIKLSTLETHYDLVYGDLLVVYNDKKELLKFPAWSILSKKMPYSMVLPHPGLAHNKNLFINKFFNTNYQVISDWIFLSDINFKQVLHLPNFIQGEFIADGISSNYPGIRRVLLERIKFFFLIRKRILIKDAMKLVLLMFNFNSYFLYNFFNKIHKRLINELS